MFYKLFVILLFILSTQPAHLTQTDPMQLEPCTEAERIQIEQLYQELDLPLYGHIGNIDPQRTTGFLLNLHSEDHVQIREEFLKELPECQDARILVLLWAVQLDMELHYWALQALYEYVVFFGDLSIEQLISEEIYETHGEYTSPLTIDEYIELLQEGHFLSSVVPLCNDERIEAELAGYTELLKSYQTLYPEFLDFMEMGIGDFDTLFVSQQIAQDGYTQISSLCAETFVYETQVVQMFTATSLAIHLKQVAAFEMRYGDEDNAEIIASWSEEYFENAIELKEIVLGE